MQYFSPNLNGIHRLRNQKEEDNIKADPKAGYGLIAQS